MQPSLPPSPADTPSPAVRPAGLVISRHLNPERSIAALRKERARPKRRWEQQVASLDPLRIRARSFGELQWICPRCGCLHARRWIGWRKGRVTCRACQKVYVVGIMFWPAADSRLPPFNAVRASAPFVRMGNRVGEPPDGTWMLARFAGAVQWECTACRAWHGKGMRPEWQTGTVTCGICQQRWAVAPIFWDPPPGPQRRPRDWTPPGKAHVAHWLEVEADPRFALLATRRQRSRSYRRGAGAAGGAQTAGAGAGGAAE